jgi:hypothetical protein
LIQFTKAFELNQCIPTTTSKQSRNMSYSKTRTTYRPSTHPTNRDNEAIKDVVISIHVMPAPTYVDLCDMRDRIICLADDRDAFAWQQALDAEIRRCRPLSEWMKMQRKEQAQPTQHARIDPAQAEQLKELLQPETLRCTYISMPVLMRKIQSDLHGIK